MTVPAGLQTVLARISSLQSGPARVAELESRFGMGLDRAIAVVQAQQAASAVSAASAASAAPAQGTFTQRSTGAGVVTSTTPSGAVPGAGAAPVSVAAPEATGSWIDRLPAPGRPWANQIAAAAQSQGLEPEFLAAVVWTESSFNPQAVSGAGAIGLGQLMPATAAWLGVDPYDPVQNLDGSARYYRNLIDRFGSLELATASYFAGPGAVSRAGGIPSDRAQSYVDKVLGRRATLLGTAPS